MARKCKRRRSRRRCRRRPLLRSPTRMRPWWRCHPVLWK
jgi:hypothetical protein